MRRLPRIAFQVLLAATTAGGLAAQDAPRTDDELTAIVQEGDTKFWKAYNACAIDEFAPLLTSTVEFYHDKGGPTLGRDALIEALRTGLCGGGSRLRREPVPGTVAIYPLHKGNEIYGAVLSGEHVFYVTLPGKPEFLDGRAHFTHLWLKEGGTFRMARILSFNHHPAVAKKK